VDRQSIAAGRTDRRLGLVSRESSSRCATSAAHAGGHDPRAGLWATDDHHLLPDYVLESYRYVRGPWREERIDGASHF